uniref:Uncharacterized protein n=1 Tax=Avena sativa TaxID=4498 RepID=A0ACD5VPV0_AVESA
MALVSSITFFLIVFACLTTQACCEYSPKYPVPSANLSAIWAAKPQLQPLMISPGIPQNKMINTSLLGDCSPRFAVGFYCTSPCKSFVFGIYVAVIDNQQYWDIDFSPFCSSSDSQDQILVWSANRDRQVQLNATLNFTANGDLVLRDADNSLVWSTNTSGQSVAGMTITELGNLVLFNQNNVSVWQSFDHPTDTLLPGQRLSEGMTLTPNASASNWTTSNQLYFTVLSDGLYAFAGSTQPHPYYTSEAPIGNNTYVTLVNGSLAMVNASSPTLNTQVLFSLPPALLFQCIRFESDGHLRLYQSKEDLYGQFQLAVLVQDVFQFQLEYCEYPTACGAYGICSRDQCSCPIVHEATFRQIDYQTPNLGCVLETPISCKLMQDHRLIAFPNVSYFYRNSSTEAELSDEESCKQLCLTTCSCKAAIFLSYGPSHAGGGCSSVTEVLTLQVDQSEGGDTYYNYSTYLKIQVAHPYQTAKRAVPLGPLLAGTIASLVLLAFALEIIRRRQHQEKDEEDEFANIPGMPTRFTFEKLKVATNEFSDKLGEGGFGTVFKGQLDDETVAIKQLD